MLKPVIMSVRNNYVTGNYYIYFKTHKLVYIHKPGISKMDQLKQVQGAITINNEGVHLLNGGNIPGALQAFQSAIAALKKAAESCQSERTQIIFQKAWNDQSLFSFEQRPVAVAGLQNVHSYIYNRPLLIPTDLKILSHVCLDSFVTSSTAFVIFNFALAHHEQGKTRGHEVSLRRAGQLYNVTLKVLANKESSNNSGAVLQCLALNNLAQLYYDNCDFQKCQFCMVTVNDFVAKTDCLNAYLDETEVDEIMLNLIYLQPPTVAGAA